MHCVQCTLEKQCTTYHVIIWNKTCNSELTSFVLEEIEPWIIRMRPRQNGRIFADDIFTCFFMNEKVWISINISLTFVPKGQINNIPALVQIMAWHRPGDKPLSEPMMFSLLTHICVTRPQWVKTAETFHMLWLALYMAKIIPIISINSSMSGNL